MDAAGRRTITPTLPPCDVCEGAGDGDSVKAKAAASV